MSNKGSSTYDILVFSFADTQTADEMVKELKASQKLGGYKVVAEAVVIREADGSVKVHEPGKGGRDATIGAIAGGALGLLNASRQDLRDNSKMGKNVRKIEEKEENCVSPNHLTPIRCTTPCRTASAV